MLNRWYQAPTSIFAWDRPLFTRRLTTSLFDEVFENLFDSAHEARSASAGPRFSSHDSGSAVVLSADVPGLSDKDIQISCKNGTLTLTGQRTIDVPEGYQQRIQERVPMRFSRTFTLSPQLDIEKAEAKIVNGVFTLTLPRLPEIQPRQIPIKAS